MARQPDVALSTTALGSPASRKILPDNSFKVSGIAGNTVDIHYKSCFVKNHAILSHLRHAALLEVLHVRVSFFNKKPLYKQPSTRQPKI